MNCLPLRPCFFRVGEGGAKRRMRAGARRRDGAIVSTLRCAARALIRPSGTFSNASALGEGGRFSERWQMNPAVELRGVTLTYGPSCRKERRSRHRQRKLRHPPWPFGLRQDHHPALDRGPGDARDRRDHRRRQAHQRCADPRAQHRPRVPELRALPAQERVRQRRFRPQISQGGEARNREQGEVGTRDGAASSVEKKLPSELSGGQQQRIALARAIVIEPTCSSSMNPSPPSMRTCARRCAPSSRSSSARSASPPFFVTHDQEEALAMSDDIVVMNHGVIEQKAPGRRLPCPALAFRGGAFSDQSNLLAGKVSSLADWPCRHRARGRPGDRGGSAARTFDRWRTSPSSFAPSASRSGNPR